MNWNTEFPIGDRKVNGGKVTVVCGTGGKVPKYHQHLVSGPTARLERQVAMMEAQLGRGAIITVGYCQRVSQAIRESRWPEAGK